LLSLVAVAISGLALVLSSVALVVASHDREVSTVAAAPGGSASELSGPATASPTANDTLGGSTEVSGPSDEETFSLPPVGDCQLVYERKQITLNPTASCAERSVDLDQPLVMSDLQGGDVTYSSCSAAPSPTLTFADPRVATVPPGKVLPEDCAQRTDRPGPQHLVNVDHSEREQRPQASPQANSRGGRHRQHGANQGDAQRGGEA
jgi:hypothetical protein